MLRSIQGYNKAALCLGLLKVSLIKQMLQHDSHVFDDSKHRTYLSFEEYVNDPIVARLRSKLDPIKVHPKVPLPVHLNLPNAPYRLGRLNISDSLIVRIVNLPISRSMNYRWSTQWSMNKLVAGFKERRVMLEVAQSCVSTVDDELKIELFAA